MKPWGAAAGLTLLLAVPAAAREAPPLIAGQREEADPDVKKSAPSSLVGMAVQVQDLIVEEEGRENQVAGLDFFIRRLQEGIRRTGNDVPRNGILENAVRARAELKDSYNGLKETLTFLIEARGILLEVRDALEPAQRRNLENYMRVKEVQRKMHDSVESMKAEPPDSKDIKNDPSGLYNLESPAYLLAPLPERIQQAAQKAAQAKIYLRALRTMHGRVENLRRKAAELDAAAYGALSDRKTAEGSESVPLDSRSEMVIENVNQRLLDTVDKAEKVQRLLETLSTPGEGLDQAVADAQQADLRILAARDQAVQSAPRIEKEDGRIFKELKPPYPGAAEEVRKALAEEAGRAKKRARDACRAMHTADDEALAAAEAAETSRQRAQAGLRKAARDVGGRQDELTDIASVVRADVPAPAQSPGAQSGAEGPVKKSKPIPPDLRRGLAADETAGVLLRQLGR